MTKRNIPVLAAVLVMTSACGRTLATPAEGSNASTSGDARSVTDEPPQPDPPVTIHGIAPKGQMTAITSGAGSVWVSAYGVPGGAGPVRGGHPDRRGD